MSKRKLTDISNCAIRQFIAYKKSLGYSYHGSILYQLQDIDHMILEFQKSHQFSNDSILSKECVEYIVQKKKQIKSMHMPVY